VPAHPYVCVLGAPPAAVVLFGVLASAVPSATVVVATHAATRTAAPTTAGRDRDDRDGGTRCLDIEPTSLRERRRSPMPSKTCIGPFPSTVTEVPSRMGQATAIATYCHVAVIGRELTHPERWPGRGHPDESLNAEESTPR